MTVPMNIAPLNFSYLGNEPCRLVVEVAGHELMQMEGRRGLFSFPVPIGRIGWVDTLVTRFV